MRMQGILKKKPEEGDGMGHTDTGRMEVQMAEKILSYVRNELYLNWRYLDVAFSALVPQADASLQSFATDGRTSVLLHRADTACV